MSQTRENEPNFKVGVLIFRKKTLCNCELSSSSDCFDGGQGMIMCLLELALV